MGLEDKVKQVIEARVAVEKLKMDIEKMDKEVILDLMTEMPDAIRIDWEKICRRLGIRSANNRIREMHGFLSRDKDAIRQLKAACQTADREAY